jgi:hypothetical protein
MSGTTDWTLGEDDEGAVCVLTRHSGELVCTIADGDRATVSQRAHLIVAAPALRNALAELAHTAAVIESTAAAGLPILASNLGELHAKTIRARDVLRQAIGP